MTILPSPIPHPLDYCPFDVPGWAYEALEWVVGFDWPEGDEKKTWDVADRWYAIAQRLAAPRDEAYDGAAEVLAGYGGTGAQAFKGAWDQLSADEIGSAFEKNYRPIEQQVLLAWEKLGAYVEGLGDAVVETVREATETDHHAAVQVERTYRTRS